MSRGGSKIVTGIICFFLGFIFAILVEIGAVFGVYWFVMNNDINTVMAAIGIPNTDDRYINTDKENGGVTTLKELLSGVQGLVFENGEIAIVGKSFDDISNLIPATQMLLNTFYGIADDYIELDHEAFESEPLMNLAQVLADSIMNIKTAALLEKLGVIDDGANLLVRSLVMGSECDYATVEGSQLKFPVMYDYYAYDENGDFYYNCNNNAGAYPENLYGREEALLNSSGERYLLYYVPCRVTASGIEEAEYIIGEYTDEESGKTFQILKYGEDTDFIAVEYNNGNFVIDYDDVYGALNANSVDASDRFTGYSYYAPYARNYYYTGYYPDPEDPDKEIEILSLKTYCGKNYFRNNDGNMIQLDALTLSDIVYDTFAPLDSILVSEVINDDKDGKGEIGKIFGTTTLGALLRGEGIDEIIDDLEVSTFVTNISPTNKVMCYIAYKISDLQDNGNGTYTAVYDRDGEDEQVVTVIVEDGFVSEVVGVEGVKVKDVAALANNMPITVLMDVPVDEPIMAYLGYGVKGIKAQTGDGYRYVGKVNDGGEDRDCYIVIDDTDGVEKIAAVWYYDDGGNMVYVGGTKVNNVANRVNGITKDLTVGDIISDEELEKSSMLRQLKSTKLSELSTAIDKLFIQRVYAEEVYGVAENSDPVLADENDFHADWLYYIKKGDDFVLANTSDEPPADSAAYDNALGHITQTEFESGTYYTYGEAKGMWRIILYNNGIEKAYTMNNFNNMVNSCAVNVYNSSLYDLQKAGVIDESKDLSKTFNGTELGEMTLEELINMVLDLPST